MKKLFALTTLVSLLATGCTEAQANSSEAAAAAVALKDIGGHWAEAQIQGAVAKHYVDGYEDGTFRPEKPVSRAEFIKMLTVAATLKPGAKGSNWYDPYVTALKEEGVLRERDFQELNGAMTRLEMAKLAVRMAKKEYADPKVQLEDIAAMSNAVKLGLIQGLTDGELAPEKTTTRAQTITIIERVLKVKAGETLEVDSAAVRNSELARSGSNFESVFGKPLLINFPYSTYLNGNVDVNIKSFIVVDMNDANDPMVKSLKETKYKNQLSPDWYKDTYVVLMPMTYTVKGAGEGAGKFYMAQGYTIGMGKALISEKSLMFFSLKEDGVYEDVLFTLISKDEAESVRSKALTYFLQRTDGTRIVFY
ncbi:MULTISPECIES: S-layer homology domain-containing protein [Paenibacillus]|uniref:S-layer homology domain-containing protein n=1 Tax=Paenibacillus TaxID=44249 RepID=UPI0022B8DA68|nr:S-layer homology domain-containing protein [Paenibacillus caseinilyticus]MCZ8520083.1 S-layer homology domain-containing protein [Paenibacillus caseinilyticus]